MPGLFDFGERELYRREFYCGEESSIMEHSITENILYTFSVRTRHFWNLTLLSMKTRKLSFHHHDTTLHDCSVLPMIEELLTPIGFGKGVESRTSFY